MQRCQSEPANKFPCNYAGGRDDSTSIAPTPSYTRPSFSREITVKVTTGSSREQAPVKSPLEERAEKVNAEAKIENAASRGEIVVGMTMDQVLKAWGSPQSRSNTTTSRSGTDSSWLTTVMGKALICTLRMAFSTIGSGVIE